MMSGVLDVFDVVVSWYQIIVHDERLAGYNAWLPGHVHQGFAWRPGSVSFGTLDIVDMRIEVRLATRVVVRPDAKRVIRVPFLVASESRLCVVASLTRHAIAIPEGSYALVYEHGVNAPSRALWCALTFVREPVPTPAVLLSDAELDPCDPLIMSAEPA